jgi:hypothetical protein
MDLATVINLSFGVIILVLGIVGYIRSKETWILWIGIAFGFFAVSHLLTLLGLKETMAALLLAIRIVGYLIVTLTVALIGFRQ